MGLLFYAFVLTLLSTVPIILHVVTASRLLYILIPACPVFTTCYAVLLVLNAPVILA